jgi:hypothetical protein
MIFILTLTPQYPKNKKKASESRGITLNFMEYAGIATAGVPLKQIPDAENQINKIRRRNEGS